MNNKELAAEILKTVGPADNVLSAANCMTRLRLELRQKPAAADALKALPGVLGINPTPTGIQIILGPGKAGQVCTEFKALLAAAPAEHKPRAAIGNAQAVHAAIKEKQSSRMTRLLQKIARIFVPLIPGFIGCGLITGLLNALGKFDPTLSSALWFQLFSIAGNAVFWGLNLFVGVNAAKECGGSPILGGIMAAVISHPLLATLQMGQQHLIPGRGGIIAVLLVTAFAAWLEKRVRKVIPEMLDLFLTPFIVIIIATFAAIYLLQPLGGMLAEAITHYTISAVQQGGALTGFILGGIFLPAVMTGLHQGLVPVHAQLLAQTGVTILLPIIAMAGAGQVGAAAAVYCKTKNAFLKKTVLSAMPVGLMGIGEPLIYGVTLPLGKPFVGACIGGAAGGAVQAMQMVGATSMGLSGLPLTLSTDNMYGYLLGLAAAYAVGFAAAYALGFDDPIDTAEEE